MAKKRFNAQQVIDALEQAKGYVGETASLLGCSAQTIYNYRDEFVTVAEAWENIRERRHDHAESALQKRIDAGDTTAIIFYLKTQCKPRGYVERTEQQQVGEQEVIFRVVHD